MMPESALMNNNSADKDGVVDGGLHQPDDVSMSGGDDTSYGEDRGGEMGIKEQAAKLERRTLARSETKAVSCLRYATFTILVTVAVLVSLFVLFYARRDEQGDFEAAFSANAERVLDSFHKAVESQIGAVDGLSVSVTAFALQTETSFPFVSIPYFEVSGAVARVLSGSVFIMWTPFVTDDNRKDYEAFVSQNKDATMKSVEFETELRDRQDASFGLDPTKQWPMPNSTDPLAESPVNQPFHNQIWGLSTGGEPQEPGTGPYLPVLQVSPAVPQVGRINNNFLEHPLSKLGSTEVLKSTKATLSVFNVMTDSPSKVDVINRFLSAGQFRVSQETYKDDYITPLTYPVFDNFDKDHTVAGVLHSNIYWRLFFDDILPPNIRGMICVLKNSRNQSISYQLDGPDVILLGGGDYHQPEYDSLAQTADVISYITNRAGPDTRGYTTAGLNPDFITYTLSVYPSDTMQADYVTNRPEVYTAIVAMIFLFTALLFIAYDILVERRQAIVMDRAVKSTAVVSSLFPEQVRDRMLNDHPEQQEQARGSEWMDTGGGDNRVKNFLEQGGDGKEKVVGGGPGRPIADKFESSTVLFADIAGFTQWSSDRDPEQVFTLLETLYGAFDALALRRSVFKVETIGDCYMAVTGVPKFQPDHAIRMVKFAKDCLLKMGDLTQELAQTLGDDTRDLYMRVGIHSGPVTAGVLRGERARFQLFGDTVNTAARMEQLGTKNRIHLSQSSADELIKSGKSDWLKAREGALAIKGKGDMQTYYVTTFGPATETPTKESDEGGANDAGRNEDLSEMLRGGES